MSAPTLPPPPHTAEELGQRLDRPRRRLGTDRLRGGRWAMWITRVLVWAVLVLAALGALRLLIERPVDDVVDEAVAGRLARDSDLPDVEAAALAERMTHDYLDYHPEEADGSDRWRQHLPADVPVRGWDGDQSLTPLHVSAVTVDERTNGELVVTVAALVAVDDQPAKWRHFAVPIAVDEDDRLVVNGSLTLTTAPAHVAVEGRDRLETDAEFTGEVADDLEGFFAAYGRGDQATVDAFTAPGTDLAALPEQAHLDELTDVSVHEGGRRRTAAATVHWRLNDPEDAEPLGVSQRYQLELQRDGDRWLIAEPKPHTDVTPVTSP